MNGRSLLGVSFLLTLSAFLVLSGCGGANGQSAAVDESWRESVNRHVSFPLANPITVTVGYVPPLPTTGSGKEDAENVSLLWLEEKTNIHFELRALQASGSMWRMAEFPEMIQKGLLPDLVPESVVDPKDQSIRDLFVDVLEFDELTPRFNALLEGDELFLNGTLGRLEVGNTLFSLGRYSPGSMPYQGALAYREDLFRDLALEHGTWAQLFNSLKEFKREYPDSLPFGATPDTLFGLLPCWFGSGFDERYACYFNYDAGEWVLGPFEDEFEEFVRYFAALYEGGLLNPHTFNPPPGQDYISEEFSRGRLVIAPWRGRTGRAFSQRFAWTETQYGNLTDQGDWDGTGAWVSAMPLPLNSHGNRGTVSSASWSNVSSGWAINKKSRHIGETIAFLDLLYDPDVALTLAMGPEGVLWDRVDGDPEMKDAIKTWNNLDADMTYAEYLSDRGVQIGFPVKGLDYDIGGLMAYSSSADWLYHWKHEVALYRDAGSIRTGPGWKFTTEDDRILSRIVGVMGRLSTMIQGEVSKFIVGSRSLDDYRTFLKDLQEVGSDTLLELLSNNTAVPTRDALPAFGGNHQSK